MDECKYNISDCDVNANCTNTYVSYKCTCKAGYTGDGHSCSGTLNFVIQDDHECVSPSTVLAHRYARSSHDAEFSYRLKQIYSVDVVDECRNTSRLYQTLASEAKGNMYNAVLCRYFFWSEAIIKTFVTLIRNKPKKVIVHIIAKKSPSSSTIILVTITLIIIITNTFVYIYISMNAARKSMFVTWMQSAVISMALITALVRMDYYWNFQLFKVQRIGWSLYKNILLFLAQLQF